MNTPMNTLPVWYFPSFSGDFRLIKRGDGCTLIVEKATLAEQAALQKFAKKIHKLLWPAAVEVGYFAKDREIPIMKSVADTGKILLKFTRTKKATLTGIVSTDGKVICTEDVEAGVDAIAKADTKAAASVSRPTPCCPKCIPGAVPRASEVLLSFLSPAEHAMWVKERAVIAVGGLSGHRYLISHRNSLRAVKQTKICFDLDDRDILHFHDWSVPPEEEVLATKLILEHREPWLRNEATVFGTKSYRISPGVTDVRTKLKFKNPFGDMMDGTKDAALTATIGGLLGNSY